jgi:hypothetical protein
LTAVVEKTGDATVVAAVVRSVDAFTSTAIAAPAAWAKSKVRAAARRQRSRFIMGYLQEGVSPKMFCSIGGRCA